MSILRLMGHGDTVAFDGSAYVLSGIDCHDTDILRAEYRIPGDAGSVFGETNMYSRRCVIRGVVLAGEGADTLAARRERLGRITAPDDVFVLSAGEYSAQAYADSMISYDTEPYYGEHTGAAGFMLRATMPYPAVRGAAVESAYPFGIIEEETVTIPGELAVGFSFSAVMSGPESSAVLTLTDKTGAHRTVLTVTYPFIRGDDLTIFTGEGGKTVTLSRDGEITDLIKYTECEEFPKLYPGENRISFSDQAASVVVRALPAYLNIEELL